MRVPGYNSPQRMTSNRLLPWILALLCLPALASNSWDSPSADFAKQIAALTGPGIITLSITNRSTLSDDDVLAIRRTLERELRSAGLSVRGKDADSAVHVTLSQNAHGLLWVAEVQEGAEIKVAMLPVGGPTTEAVGPTTPSITLKASLVQAQAEPTLDAAVFGGATDQHLVVLEPEHIKMFSQGAGNWQLTKTYDIAHTQPLPRDLRGRVASSTDHLFDAYLPGVVCSATRIGDTWEINVTCSDSDDPWPLASQKAFYNSTRDFFTGVVTPGFGPKLPPFYSATEIARTGSNTFLFNDLGGTVHALEGNAHKTLIGARDWGSDFTAVHSGCGQGTQVLASAAGWPVSDSIRAYEITGREATPVSAAYTFDGIITAVWPSSDAASAVVVVQKQQESRYEAYSVSVVCNR
jgi:hypothetical protein